MRLFLEGLSTKGGIRFIPSYNALLVLTIPAICICQCITLLVLSNIAVWPRSKYSEHLLHLHTSAGLARPAFCSASMLGKLPDPVLLSLFRCI